VDLTGLADVGKLAAGALIGALAALIVARMNRGETRRSRLEAREDRALDRKDARRARFVDRKVELAAQLLLAADLHADEARRQVGAKVDRWTQDMEYGQEAVEGYNIPTVGPTQPVREAFLALDLVAPAIAGSAGDLYIATVPLGELAGRWPDPRFDSDQSWSRDWTIALERWDAAREAFVEAVRSDLGVVEA